MKVAIIGHSFVRDLESLSVYNFALVNNTECEIRYYYINGSCFHTWSAWPLKLIDCFAFRPDIVFTVLGGNTISEFEPIALLKSRATAFFFSY